MGRIVYYDKFLKSSEDFLPLFTFEVYVHQMHFKKMLWEINRMKVLVDNLSILFRDMDFIFPCCLGKSPKRIYMFGIFVN